MLLSNLFVKKDKSITMSMPSEETLYGVNIHKLTIAKYIEVMRTLDDLPKTLFGALPEFGDVNDLISFIAGLDRDKMVEIITRLLTVAPEQICRLLSKLLDIPEQRLLDSSVPDGLGLTELVKILEAFWRKNDMTDFFQIVRRLSQPSAQNTGSSGG